MKQIKITKFRAHLPAYLQEVQAGETITVTSRGKPVACVVPAARMAAQARERLAELRKQAHLGDVVSPLHAEWGAARDRA